MARRSSLSIAVAVCASAASVSAVGPVFAQNASSIKPNILFLTADDLNCDSVGCFGSLVRDATPNLDRLAASGIRFDRAHATTGVCSPARSVMMTGRNGYNTGAGGFTRIRPEIPTLNEILRKNGYYCAVSGKATFDESGLVYKGGWDQVYDGISFDLGRNASLFYKNTMEVIANARSESKPFFLWLNTCDPHRPFFDSDDEKKRPWTRWHASTPSRIYKPEEIAVPEFLPDLPDIRRELAHYYSSVRRADDSMGEALRALRESGLESNTIVLFLSDQGMALPFAKTAAYPASSRTPFILRWPGTVAAGSCNNGDYVTQLDIAPTLLDILGIKMPGKMDGVSFLPLLKGGKQKDRHYFVYSEDQGQAYPQPGLFDPTKKGVLNVAGFPHRAIEENGKYRYIFTPWSGHAEFQSDTMEGLAFPAMQKAAAGNGMIAERVKLWVCRVPEELYDIEKDPACLNNLIGDQSLTPTTNRLRSLLRQYMVNHNDYMLRLFDNRADKDFSSTFFREDLTGRASGDMAETKEYSNSFCDIPSKVSGGIIRVSLKRKGAVTYQVRTWNGKDIVSGQASDNFQIDLQSAIADGSFKGKELAVEVFLFFPGQVVMRKVMLTP